MYPFPPSGHDAHGHPVSLRMSSMSASNSSAEVKTIGQNQDMLVPELADMGSPLQRFL
jgi:hypothetical protein